MTDATNRPKITYERDKDGNIISAEVRWDRPAWLRINKKLVRLLTRQPGVTVH